MSAIFALASTPWFSALDSSYTQPQQRLTTLDGLRGFLALAVCFHHAAVYHVLLTGGAWLVPPSHFYSLIGRIAVYLFFMITGYLFWSRLIEHYGRMDWLSFYIGRIFRIGPLYLAAFAAVVFGAFAHGHFTLRVPLRSLAGQIASGANLGFYPILNIDGYSNSYLLLDGVTWTLQYEWIFYLALPLLALATTSRRLHLPFVLAAFPITALLMRLPGHPLQYLPFQFAFAGVFLLGMLAASLRHQSHIPHLPDRLASILVLAAFAWLFTFGNERSAGSIAITGCIFYLIVSGCSVFGLLLTRPARRLGVISYGLYILQGLPHDLLFRMPFFKPWLTTSPILHWTLTLAAAILLLVLATIAHLWIEQPGIDLGKRIARAARIRSAVPAIPPISSALKQ